MENDTLLSDIILPTTTRFEEYDINAADGDVWLVENCIAPLGEAKTDYEVSLEVAKKLGPEWVEKYTWGRSVEDWMKYGWDSRQIEKSSGIDLGAVQGERVHRLPRTTRIGKRDCRTNRVRELSTKTRKPIPLRRHPG